MLRTVDERISGDLMAEDVSRPGRARAADARARPAGTGAFRAVGQPLPRKEDLRLLTGRGHFSDDARAEGQAYAALVRSPYPHARILAVRAEAARAMPGVLAVLSGADCAADGIGPLPHSPLPSTRYDMKLSPPAGRPVFIGPQRLLPADRARHVGEAVAMVVAQTREQALDAVEQVVVDYEELPWVSHSEDALRPGAPRLWDEAPDNLLIDTWFGDREATERAFARADRVVEASFHIGRVTAVAMEPRAALGWYDPRAGRYTLHAGSGGAVRQKRELATALGIEPEALRILCEDVGGNFGSKNRAYVEYALVLWAARRLGRPVKYTASRAEAFLTDYQGRDLVSHVALALAADGRFLAMRAHNISNVGAHCVSLSPLGKGSGLITGSYRMGAASLRAQAVFTNTMPTNAYRSSGRPEVTYALERLVDLAADTLGIDRLEIRRRNLVAPTDMPYANAVGSVYDSGEYAHNMDRALELSDWHGFQARREAAARRGLLLGRGFANYVESSIGSPFERAEISVQPDDRVRVVIGTQPSGQGHETSFAQVASDLLHVPVAAIDVVMGDTDIVSVGGGSHSGRSMRHAATVLSIASQQLIERGRHLAAHLWGVAPAAVHWQDGRWMAAGASGASQVDATHATHAADAVRGLDLIGLARALRGRALPAALAGGLAVATDHEMHDPVFPNGAAVCECEVDPETGVVQVSRYTAVDDVGRCINPLIVDGQTHGAIAQGLGQALSEQCYIDPQSGQPLSGSLLDYGLPRAADLPSFASEIIEVLSPTNPLGIKAGGEGGTTPSLAALVSAVLDALGPLGVRELTMPVTPQAVWRAIQEAGQAARAGAGA
jgi:carbon-monoxide dehydrogenase large subunit